MSVSDGLNLSNEQIAAELDLASEDAQAMTSQRRAGVVEKKPVELSREVEADEVHLVADHKGYPEIVQKLGRKGRRWRLKGQRERDTLEKEKPPLLGLFHRSGEVAIQMLPAARVQQTTIRPVMVETVKPESLLYRGEYDINSRLPNWGYGYKTARRRVACPHGFHEVMRSVCQYRGRFKEGIGMKLGVPVLAVAVTGCMGHTTALAAWVTESQRKRVFRPSGSACRRRGPRLLARPSRAGDIVLPTMTRFVLMDGSASYASRSNPKGSCKQCSTGLSHCC